MTGDQTALVAKAEDSVRAAELLAAGCLSYRLCRGREPLAASCRRTLRAREFIAQAEKLLGEEEPPVARDRPAAKPRRPRRRKQ